MEKKIRFDKLFFSRHLESWEGISTDDFIGFITPKCKEVITINNLESLLSEDRKLQVKFGIDPTASDIHIGHLVPMMLLNQFLRAGHRIDFIIGDFTAIVGDPTERIIGRIPLTCEQIRINMATFHSQVERFIDLTRVNVHFNSSWLNSMSLIDVFSIFQKINLTEAVQRDDFRKRIANSQAVSLAEVCYGVLMGIDSVHLLSDIEIGGIDQLLNFQQCRKIMKEKNLKEEVALMTPLIEGTDGSGKKMSKSFGNTIPVSSSFEDKFGKMMSIPDRLIFQYFCSFADVNRDEIEELRNFTQLNPMEAKKQLATTFVAIEAKSFSDALFEREQFERKFSKKVIVDDDCLKLAAELDQEIFGILLATGKFKTKSELRRLFEQNSVRLLSGNNQVVLKSDYLIKESCKVRIGKLHFFMINIS